MIICFHSLTFKCLYSYTGIPHFIAPHRYCIFTNFYKLVRPSTSKKITTRFTVRFASFIAVVWNRTCNISEALCFRSEFFYRHLILGHVFNPLCQFLSLMGIFRPFKCNLIIDMLRLNSAILFFAQLLNIV